MLSAEQREKACTMSYFCGALIVASLVFAPAAALACIPTDWTRHEGPVHRDRMFLGLYEAASDAHVFPTEDGRLAMIYSGDDGGQSAILLAFGQDWTRWETWGVLLGPSRQPSAIAHKETAFYRRAGPADHRLYFIGYADEDTYGSDIYVARAQALTGPWRVEPEPIIRRGLTDGRDVRVITSPSVVEHEGGVGDGRSEQRRGQSGGPLEGWRRRTVEQTGPFDRLGARSGRGCGCCTRNDRYGHLVASELEIRT